MPPKMKKKAAAKATAGKAETEVAEAPVKGKTAAEKAEARKEPKKEEPKKEEPTKEQGEKKAEKPAPTAEQKAAKEMEATKEILKGLENHDHGTQGNFIVQAWQAKYKPFLGAYKKFIESKPDTFKVHVRENGMWLVLKAGQEPPAESEFKTNKPPEDKWKQLLNAAWRVYCSATPKQERSIETFVSVLPEAVRNTRPVVVESEEPVKGRSAPVKDTVKEKPAPQGKARAAKAEQWKKQEEDEPRAKIVKAEPEGKRKAADEGAGKAKAKKKAKKA